MSKSFNYKPLGNRVIVKIREQEKTSPGGIIIPDNAKEKPIEGEVVSVGNGSKDDKGNHKLVEVKAGDVVFFNKWSGTELKVGDQVYLVLSADDLLAVKE